MDALYMVNIQPSFCTDAHDLQGSSNAADIPDIANVVEVHLSSVDTETHISGTHGKYL